MRESQKNRRTDETEGTGILWPGVSYDPEAPAGQNISFATEGRDADLSVRAEYPLSDLKSMGFDSILKEAEGRNRKDGKENTGLKTRYSAKELLER